MNFAFSTFKLFTKAGMLFAVRNNYRLMDIAIVLLLACHGVPLSAQTVIGGSTPDPSAMLDVQGTEKGVLIPRLTTSQRNAITSPATGLLIINTDIKSLEINLGTPASPSWQVIVQAPGTIATIGCANARFVGSGLRSPIAASGNSLRVPYTGGNGAGYSSQTVMSTGVTGLTATLAAGNFATGADSLTYTITGTPSADGIAGFALNVGGQTCTLNVIVGCGAYVGAGQWKTFACYNLGAANTSVDPYTPSWEIAGGYWQWGKLAEAAAGPTNATSPNDGPVGGWSTTPAVNGAWADNMKTGTDPCPTGFRVPTKTQWQEVTNSTLNPVTEIGPFNNSATNFSRGLKLGNNLLLPSTGIRSQTDGSLSSRGSDGNYWSSTEVNTQAWHLYFNTTAVPSNTSRNWGMSIRCIAD